MSKVIEAIKVSKIYGFKSKPLVTGNPISDTVQGVLHAKLDTLPHTVALDDINLEIDEGDFVCIMGPSGSGKTTLLNVLSTIDKPTKGNVLIQNVNVRQMGDIAIGDFRNKYLGFIFQNYNLLDNLTIFENVAMPLSIAKCRNEEITTSVQKIAKRVGIEDLLNKYPTECSGGQRQRCALARALISNPKLIVADELTGNLDSKNSHAMLKLLKQLNEEYGVTILIVTHDAMIASYAKRLLFLLDGKIDTISERGSKTQKAFYSEIMKITSYEALQFLDEQ